MERSNKVKINFILFIVYTELILGGLGRLFNLPIRICLFIIILIAMIFDILRHEKIYITKNVILGVIGIGIIIGLYFMYSVIILGNPIESSVEYVQVYISILYIPIIQQLVRNKKESVNYLIELLLVYVYVLSIVTILLFIGSFFAEYIGIDALEFMLQLKKITNYGIITGWLYDYMVVRVYFANGIFMQLAFAILGCKWLNSLATKKDKIRISVIFIAIICSNTRGYWLGLIVVLAIIFLYSKKKIRYLFVLLISMAITSILLTKVGLMDDIINRIVNMTNFETEISNVQRKYQMDLITEGIKFRPLMGYGVGSSISGYYELTGRDSNDVEVFYHELVYKTGYIGLFIYLGIIIIAIIKSFYLKNRYCTNLEKSYISGWAIGLISVLITSTSNPYLKGANGFFTIVMFFVIYNIYFTNKRNDDNGECNNSNL